MAIAFKKRTVHRWKEVQFFEEYGLHISEKGQKIMTTLDLKFIHLENPIRFTLSGFLRRRNTQGYWWHIVTAHVDISAWPLKISSFVTLIVLSTFNILYFYILMMLSASWIVFRIYSRKGRVRFCMSKFKNKTKIITSFLIIIVLFILEDFAVELGKIHAITDRILGKVNM